MPSADPSQRWQIALPTGTEGPYTESELRDLVRAGRVRPDDHLVGHGFQGSCTVVDVVRDARQLAVGTDRVVRRSRSDRLGAVNTASTGSEIRRLRTPLPGMADVRTQAASPADVQPVPDTAPLADGHRRKPILLVTLLGLSVTLSTVLLIWPPELPAYHGLQPYGVWRLERFAGKPGPWLVHISETSIDITAPDGTNSSSQVTYESATTDEIRAVLATPHPLFGDHLALAGRHSVTLTTPIGSGTATRVP